MRWRASGNSLLQGALRPHHRVVLVAFIQRVVRAFDKDFRPLNERCGQESGHRADDDFLEKGGLHGRFNSSEGARIAQCLPFSA